MLHDDEASPPSDGRVARRERNINAVLDVVIEMYGEDMLFPTIEQVSKRSGLSLRSLYRYFADPGELHQAAIAQHRQMTMGLSRLPSIGEGRIGERITDFVDMRVRLYEVAAPVFRASAHSAYTDPKASEALAGSRRAMSKQFDQQFGPELGALAGPARKAVQGAGDVLTQLDSIDLFRRDRGLSVSATKATLTAALQRLFDDAS